MFDTPFVPFHKVLGDLTVQLVARRGQDEEAGRALGPHHPVPLTVLHQALVRLVVTGRRNPVEGEPAREGQAVRLTDTCVYHVIQT